MKIYIAKNNNTKEEDIIKAKEHLMLKLDLSSDAFVFNEPNIIYFLNGGSEQDALSQISVDKRYCFIASIENNSWAAATEVKALMNFNGVKTKIFDINNINSNELLFDFLYTDISVSEKYRLGLIGSVSKNMVASMPDFNLLKDILDIEVVELNFEDFIKNYNDACSTKSELKSYFEDISEKSNNDGSKLLNLIHSVKKENNLDAISINCFDIIDDFATTVCLPFSVLNSEGFPAICEGDVCAGASMIVAKRLLNTVPWLCNLIHVDRTYASFSHCSIPLNLTNNYKIENHYETNKEAAIKAELREKEVTVFRIDKNLESCFIALGKIEENNTIQNTCKTNVKVRLSQKSLFLLKEFPLGNHHLMLFGDHSDALANFFAEKNIRVY